MAELTPGSMFGEFRIEGIVARGGMGIVYRARHERLGRLTALKIIAPHLAQDEGFRERFRREAQMSAAIDHPNILPIYDAGEIDGQPYLAMRFVDGTDLRTIIDSQSPLDPERAIAIVERVALALDAAHARNLIHRDVKPANILIDVGTSGHDGVYLTDFGLTRGRTDTRLTQTGTWVGTVDYMAPEQFESRQSNERVDQYSLACVLYEALTGVRPFERDSDVQVMFAHIREDPPAASAARTDLPAGVDDPIRRGMAKIPEERFDSCTALIAAVRAGLSGAPATTLGTAPGVAPAATVVGDATLATPPAPEPATAETVTGPPATQPGETPVPEPVYASAPPPPAQQPYTPPPPQFSSGQGAQPPRPGRTRQLALIGGAAAALVAGVVTAVVVAGGGDDPIADTTKIETTTTDTTDTTGTTDTTDTTGTEPFPPQDPNAFPPATAQGVLDAAAQPATGVIVYDVVSEGFKGKMRVATDATRFGLVFRGQGIELRLFRQNGETQWACARQGQSQTFCFKASSLNAETAQGLQKAVNALAPLVTDEGQRTLFTPIVALNPEVYEDRQVDRRVACVEKVETTGRGRICTTRIGHVTDISAVSDGQAYLVRATSMKDGVLPIDFQAPAPLQ